MRHFLSTSAAAACLALCAAQAQADTVKLTGYTYTPNKSVNVSIDLPGSANDMSYGGGAGEFKGTLNGQSFKTYCLDLYEEFYFNTTYTDYHLVALDHDTAFDMGRLITKHRGEVDTAQEAAAFQVALWEILYETAPTYSLTSGAFRETASNDGIRLLAQNWLNDLGTVSNVNVFKLESIGYYDNRQHWVAGHQDFLVTTPVPEPSTNALMAAGLLGIGYVVRRRSQPR
jgi:hypothetical protein